jgi:hypothetical protein
MRHLEYVPTFPTQSLKSRMFSGTHWDVVRRYPLSTKDLKLVRRTDVLCLGMHFKLTVALSRGLNGRELFLCRQLKNEYYCMWPPRTPPRKYSGFSRLFASFSLPSEALLLPKAKHFAIKLGPHAASRKGSVGNWTSHRRSPIYVLPLDTTCFDAT